MPEIPTGNAMSETETVQTFQVILPEPVLTKFEKEKRAFYRLLPDLLQTHRNQYVAIHDEQVVDFGMDEKEVILRAQAKVQGGVYVELVSQLPRPVYRSGIVRVLSPSEVGG